MAARPGEDVAATLYGDIHYYYGSPKATPPHHRFEKGSYVYLYENAAQKRARLEIANNAGTEEQDAFTGFLDAAHLEYSYDHSNLVTLVVNSQRAQAAPSPTDKDDWRLPWFNERNETKYMYKLHTVDIYFWTKEDAIEFVDGIRRVLPAEQLMLHGEPKQAAPPPHQKVISPVVQKLENMAISDPSYQNGQTRDSRSSAAPSFAGPPISATPQSLGATNFAPMAYNPAAPAAPEEIKHREKTPPPDDGAGNPLLSAVQYDYGQMSNPSAYPTHAPSFPGPPSGQPSGGYFPGHLQRAATTPAQISSPGFAPTPGLQSQGPHIPVTQFATYPLSPGPPSSLDTPNMGVFSPPLVSPSAVPMPYSPPPVGPPGGFSQFSYAQQQGAQPLMNDYSIHQQLYRPTEFEATTKHNSKPAKPPRGKLEERADRLEKGVGGFLKKLEKKIG